MGRAARQKRERAAASPAAVSVAAVKEREREAVRQVRASVSALLEEGRAEEAVEYCAAAVETVLQKNAELALLIAKLRRTQAHSKSERVAGDQLRLMLEQLIDQLPEAERALVEEAQQDAAVEAELAEEKRARPRERGLGVRAEKWTTRGVDKRIHQVEVPKAERICSTCGREKQRMGEDVTRTLELVPARFVEHEYHREKYACGTCKRGVTTAPAPPKVIERCSAGASVLAQVVVNKYADHMPLHRQHRLFERNGAVIPVSTLADWVAAVADRVEPLVDRIAARVLGSYLVQTDATGLMALDPNSHANIERGTVWAYVGDARYVLFRYTPTGHAESGPWTVLRNRKGYVQADAAAVFDRLFNGQVSSAIEVGCWAHARRYFVALQDTDVRVAVPLKAIRSLYQVEELADLRELGWEDRAALRAKHARPVLDRLKIWLVRTLLQEPPSSALAQAAGYCFNQWDALNRFVSDGRLGLDNNRCEQQLRDIALGRKNFLFAGSHEAGQRAALLYSLLRTAVQHRVAPLPYLTDVLNKLANGWKQGRLDELLPDQWRDLHSGSADP